MLSEPTTWVGLDVHKKTVAVAILQEGSSQAIVSEEPNERRAIERLVRRLKRQGGDRVHCCYEAGPTGYALQRQLISLGVDCRVVAPSLTPIQPGVRIKTDRRDARKLAELFRAGLLTEVQAPTEADEALRDLCRCREDVSQDFLRARHRMSKFLLRRHCLCPTSSRNWGSRYMVWLRQLRFEDPASQATFDSYLLALDQLEERLHQLEQLLEEHGERDPYRQPVAWLRCFRGIDTVTAVSLVAELHGFERFRSPRSLMAFLGLVPSERSSGLSERRGSITKAGNGHVRRLLIEAAWHHRHRPVVATPLRRRRAGQPARVIALADRASERLHRRYVRMSARGKPLPKVVVALARELAGFIWATLHPNADALSSTH